MKKCDCKDWEENIEKVTIAVFRHVHNMDYDGMVFRYCPWCSKKLKKDEDKKGEKE